MNTEPYTYDFTVLPRDTGLRSTCWMNGARLSNPFSEVLPANAADLLDLALAIYAADRSSRRDYKRSDTGQRRIDVQLALRNPDYWTAPGTADRLQEFLYWLSGDEWSFRLERRGAAQTPAESGAFLLKVPLEPPVSVSLFSGGLDSLAGLACRTVEELGGSRVLVSGYTHNRLRSRQQSQVQYIRSVLDERSPGTGASVWHVAVGFGMRRPERGREERGQRTRALVFLALGATAAVQAGTDTLWVYENGVGALNLPINETQLGLDNYRGVHPRSLRMFEALVEPVLGREVRVRNPFLFHTKAEMCRPLLPAGLAGAVEHTITCDSFPMRIPDQASQCGHCTSCVLRRQALHAAGLGAYDPASAYRHDVRSGRAALSKDKVYDIEAMRGQVQRLEQTLASGDPWRSLKASFPELARTSAELGRYGGLDAARVGARFVRLFQTYVCEWRRFMPQSD